MVRAFVQGVVADVQLLGGRDWNCGKGLSNPGIQLPKNSFASKTRWTHRENHLKTAHSWLDVRSESVSEGKSPTRRLEAVVRFTATTIYMASGGT